VGAKRKKKKKGDHSNIEVMRWTSYFGSLFSELPRCSRRVTVIAGYTYCPRLFVGRPVTRVPSFHFHFVWPLGPWVVNAAPYARPIFCHVPKTRATSVS
jgi:hypothetical protein